MMKTKTARLFVFFASMLLLGSSMLILDLIKPALPEQLKQSYMGSEPLPSLGVYMAFFIADFMLILSAVYAGFLIVDGKAPF